MAQNLGWLNQGNQQIGTALANQYTPTQFQWNQSASTPNLPAYDYQKFSNQFSPAWTFAQNPLGQDAANRTGITKDGNINFGAWTNDQQRGALKSYLENYAFPAAQYQSNQQQQLWDQYMQGLNYNMQTGMNQFNMGLANQQQSLQNWLANEQARQFAAQFGLESNVANWRYGQQGTERYAIDQEMARLREQLANDLIQSRYMAFGRAQAPNPRATVNWG